MSGLHLNLPKTVIIPLGDRTPEQVAQWLRDTDDPWQNVTCAHHGPYLGFMVGPGKGTRSWTKPVAKALSRAAAWAWSALGLQFAAEAYNTFVLPTLTFVAQLEKPPPEALQAEEKALVKAAKGPGQ